MRFLRSFITTGALAVLASSCARAAESPLPIFTPESPAPLPTSPTPGAGSDRYVNLEAGLSLALPAGWSTSGPYPVPVGETSYDLYLLGLDPSPNAGPGASRLIVAADDRLSIEEFTLSQCTECPSSEWVETALNGIPVLRAVIGGGGVPFEVEWIFIDHGGRLIGLSIHDPQTMETLYDVLDTLSLE